MGLFSRKTRVCEKCGKEFELRFAFGGSAFSFTEALRRRADAVQERKED